MALIDVVKCDSTSFDEIVWKFPHDEIAFGAQLIVNESQEAVFFKGGQALDVFGPGTHSLKTGNIPLLKTIIKMPFGGKTPFSAEVWFVNKTMKRNLWGTPHPIQVMDPVHSFPVTVRAHGLWGMRVDDSRSFLTQIVGTIPQVDTEKVVEYFRGHICSRLNNEVASFFSRKGISIFDANSRLNELSLFMREDLRPEFAKYGIEITNFEVQNISIPQEEMAKFQEAREVKLRVDAIGQTNQDVYRMMKSFDVMEKAANNQGAAGGAMGAGLGLGVGFGAAMPIAQQIGQNMSVAVTPAQQIPQNAAPANDPVQALKKLKDMLDAGLISQNDFDAKKGEILKNM
jgi:membrane protease subunit (stomatin/prohibitin family)